MGVDIAEVVGGLIIGQREARGQGFGQKPETEQSWLGFGHAT